MHDLKAPVIEHNPFPWDWFKKPANILHSLAFFGGIFLLLFVFSECVWYYPITALGLERDGSTRVAAKTNEVTICVAGDVMLWGSLAGEVRVNGWDYPFRYTKQIVSAADIAIGNLEGPLTTSPIVLSNRRYTYQVPPASVAGLTAAGFDAMALANNHVRDCGNPGIASSITTLSNAGIAAFGAGMTEKDARRPLLRTIKGVRLAIFNWMQPVVHPDGSVAPNDYFAAHAGQAGAAIGMPGPAARELAEARKAADVLIVIMHIGDRYEEREMAPLYGKYLRSLVDLGADAVICHGSHAMGPVERYKGKPIWYGIGNYAFGSRNILADYSLLAVLHIDTVTKKLARIMGVPMYICNANPFTAQQARILDGYRASLVLKRLVRWSKALDSGLTIQGNVVWQGM